MVVTAVMFELSDDLTTGSNWLEPLFAAMPLNEGVSGVLCTPAVTVWLCVSELRATACVTEWHVPIPAACGQYDTHETSYTPLPALCTPAHPAGQRLSQGRHQPGPAAAAASQPELRQLCRQPDHTTLHRGCAVGDDAQPPQDVTATGARAGASSSCLPARCCTFCTRTSGAPGPLMVVAVNC